MAVNLKRTFVAVELTNRCNLSCSMCPARSLGRSASSMSWSLVLSIAHQLADLGVRVTWLHEMGEPLLYPRLAEAVRLFPGSAVSTNGTLLDEVIADSLLESGLTRLRICLDTTDPVTYRRLRPGGDHQRVIGNTRRFLELARGYPIRIEVQHLVTRLNRHESVADFERLLGSRQYNNVFFIRKICSGLDTSEATDLHPAWKGCMARSPIRWFVVLADGRVTHCCYDVEGTQTIGNLTRQTVEEVAGSAAVEELRRSFRRRDFTNLPRCRECYRGAGTTQLAVDAALRLSSGLGHILWHQPYPESTALGRLAGRMKTLAFIGAGQRQTANSGACRRRL